VFPIVSVKVEVLEKETVKIYRMATLDPHNNPLVWVSSYLIDGLLIDFGHHHAKDSFLELLDFDDIEICVLSHHHEDHIGACHDLINKFNVPIYGNKETVFLVLQKIRIPHERMITWGLPKPFKASLLPNLRDIKTKQASFKIIPSPGHCYNLISFFHENKRLLFSTDAILNERQNVIFNWENALLMLETFNNLKNLNPKYIFLEDGRVITTKELDNLITYWLNLKKRSEELYEKSFTSRQIVKKIFGKESWLKTATGGDISRENLIRSLLILPPIFKRNIRKKGR
jgi:glyoxylase-like metal-dependent hydrolase (beta-lactamase superfamily II)